MRHELRRESEPLIDALIRISAQAGVMTAALDAFNIDSVLQAFDSTRIRALGGIGPLEEGELGFAVRQQGSAFLTFSDDFILAAGGIEQAGALIESYIVNFGNSVQFSADQAQRALDAQKSQLDIINETTDIDLSGITLDNFNEEFEKALPTLSAKDLVAFLQYGDGLVRLNALEQDLFATRSLESGLLKELNELTEIYGTQLGTLAQAYRDSIAPVRTIGELQTDLFNTITGVTGDDFDFPDFADINITNIDEIISASFIARSNCA